MTSHLGVHLTESGDIHEHNLTVSWTSVDDTFKPFGNYTCRAKRLKDESIEEAAFLVNKIKPAEPATYRLEGMF